LEWISPRIHEADNATQAVRFHRSKTKRRQGKHAKHHEVPPRRTSQPDHSDNDGGNDSGTSHVGLCQKND
jgi:hypothetical protein